MVYIFRVILVSSASLILSSFMSMLPFSLVLLFPFICPFPSTLYRFCFILCYYCVSSVCLDLRQVVLFPSYYVCEIVFHTIAFFRLPHLPPVFCVVSLSSVSISLLLPPSHLCGLWFMSLVTTIFNLQSSRTILLLLLPLCNQAPYPDPPP